MCLEALRGHWLTQAPEAKPREQNGVGRAVIDWGWGADSQLDALGHGQRSGVTYLVSAKELLLGHEAVLCLQLLGGRFILHGRRRVDRGHWGWSWDRGHRWSGHKGWKDRNKQLCEWGKSPGIRAGDNLRGEIAKVSCFSQREVRRATPCRVWQPAGFLARGPGMLPRLGSWALKRGQD